MPNTMVSHSMAETSRLCLNCSLSKPGSVTDKEALPRGAYFTCTHDHKSAELNGLAQSWARVPQQFVPGLIWCWNRIRK